MPTLLFLGTSDDEPYKARLKSMVGSATVYVKLEPISTITEVEVYCKSRNITGVFSTNTVLLGKLLASTASNSKPALSNYAGSYFKRNGIEYVFIHPLEQLNSIAHVPFLTRRFISKLSAPEDWASVPEFDYALLQENNIKDFYEECKGAIAIACDIETFKTPLSIRCIGYSAIFIDSTSVRIRSGVLPLTSTWALAWMRKFNALPAPKIFQRGKYDIAYLQRYNAVPYAYLWDTANMFHCMYSEMPKDLGFLNAFFIRTAIYWKDLAHTNDLSEYYRYNALDTWATANVFLRWIIEAPQWAKQNYLIEFPTIFPCHMSEMIGLQRDIDALKKAREEILADIKSKEQSIQKMVGVPTFNVNSHVQCKQLLRILGCGDIAEISSDEKHIEKARYRHPLNARILQLILDIRGQKKLLSTYLSTGEDSKDFGPTNRILYSLNPDNTDTGRLASRDHAFWCGANIQNIPRGKEVKQTVIADSEFLFAECDLEQAESRDTAHISGDEKLIAAVTGPRDFHSVNAAAFFGRNYEDIYDDGAKKTRDKILRDLSKRVNHGANYVMGPDVLVDTMGLENIYRAAKALGLPRFWSPRDIAEFLLEKFHSTYPSLRAVYYPEVIAEIIKTNMLIGATGWTRYCFGRPDKNKRDLNRYIAHPPQSLNAQILNKAYLRVFYDIAIHPEHARNFKLGPQIHDSILFQFRTGHVYLCAMVKERMEIPVRIKGYDGKTREFTVPAAIKAGKEGIGSHRWSEVE